MYNRDTVRLSIQQTDYRQANNHKLLTDKRHSERSGKLKLEFTLGHTGPRRSSEFLFSYFDINAFVPLMLFFLDLTKNVEASPTF